MTKVVTSREVHPLKLTHFVCVSACSSSYISLDLIQEYCTYYTLSLLVANNLCNQFGPRSGSTKHRSWSVSKQFDSLIVFLKTNFEIKSVNDKKHAKFS